MNRALLIRLAKILIPIFMLTLIYIEGKSQLHQIETGHLLFHLKRLSIQQSGLIILVGLFGTLTMVLYDFTIIRQMNLKIPLLKTIKYGWIANTFNNVIGFGGFAGASLRGLLYKTYNINNNNSFIPSLVWLTPLTLSGLSVFAWLAVFGFFPINEISQSHKWLPIVLIGIGLYLPAYLIVWLIKNHKKEHYFPRFFSIFLMVLASMIEWFFAIITIWVITKELGLQLSFSYLFGIFIAAAAAGVISMLPGGFGSFDLMMLIGLRMEGLPSQAILLSLLLYRFSYFFAPWFIGLFLASTEVVTQTRQFVTSDKWRRRIELWSSYSTFPISILSSISQWALSALIFVAGCVLLLSAATPGIIERIRAAEAILSAPVMNFSNQVSVAAGLALILLSRSLFHRVKRAHTLTLFALIIGAAFTFTKGFDYEEAITLLLITTLLWVSQKRFTRENYPLTWTAIISGIIVLIVTLSFYISLGYFNHPFQHLHLPKHILNLLIWHPHELLKNGLIGSVIAVIALILGFYLKPMNKVADKPNIDEAKVSHVLEQYGGNVLAHLAFLKDKVLFWNEANDVFIMYRRIGDKLVVLGDPIGNKKAFLQAIWEFQDYADQYGMTPLFYQVEKSYLPTYHEAGYQFFKLGEEAYVELDHFTLAGKKGKNFRAVKNKFTREGYHFEWLEPPFSEAIFAELKELSDEWLGERHEKGFSLGFFSTDYLDRVPVVLLRDPECKALAFASLMPVYDQNTTLSVDLMRHKKETPNGTMDMLFISLLEAAKEKGYKRFNLGMAPLSNVGISKYAFVGERIAYRIFLYGSFFYQFKGLRRYKEKFADTWEPKYLAFRGRISLPIAMLQISLLIGKKRKKTTNEHRD